MKKEWNSKTKLTLGDKCILSRNQNEIKELRQAMILTLRNYNRSISELARQNHEILGRGASGDKSAN